MGTTTDRLQDEHTDEAIARRIQESSSHSYLGDFLLGAVDGAVTTFAIAAGAVGAGLSNGVVVVLGLANVLADGFSMAAGNYLKAQSDQQILERFRRLERMHIEQVPERERAEIRQIYRAKGFEGELLDQIVAVITQDRQRWINTMLTEEWGLRLKLPSPWRAALATFTAFVIAGMVPLLPALVALDASSARSFLFSCLLTAAAFFIIGVIRGHLVSRDWRVSGLETLGIGGSAAAIAYLVGVLLKRIAGL